MEELLLAGCGKTRAPGATSKVEPRRRFGGSNQELRWAPFGDPIVPRKTTPMSRTLMPRTFPQPARVNGQPWSRRITRYALLPWHRTSAIHLRPRQPLLRPKGASGGRCDTEHPNPRGLRRVHRAGLRSPFQLCPLCSFTCLTRRGRMERLCCPEDKVGLANLMPFRTTI